MRAEAELQNDLVMEDFQDSYGNLTLKTTFLLKVLTGQCPQAQFILKADDDVFVNPEKLWNIISNTLINTVKINNTELNYTLIGKKQMNIRPFRDKRNKWYLPTEIYPSDVFPPYLQGLAYVLSGSLLGSLYSCTLSTPVLPIEDVFLTGLCASQKLNLSLTHHKVSPTD